ncbi:unnamed protein product [Ostreobium quekettii]|uniref:Uncharacterized protein n=1 Tax=Ostreobium quekettii TaxID=121088 RepID=A0A8S1J557_9CHLO|nr:unnamed protein product [Ostreobium quekettii]
MRFLASTSAPALASTDTTSSWPSEAANKRAVSSVLVKRDSTSAPVSNDVSISTRDLEHRHLCNFACLSAVMFILFFLPDASSCRWLDRSLQKEEEWALTALVGQLATVAKINGQDHDHCYNTK